MTTQPDRPQVGSVGSGSVLPDAPQPAPQASEQQAEVQWRPRSTRQDAANFFTEDEFEAMDRAREAVRSGAFTAEDAERYRPANPAPLSADWWRADPSGRPRSVGEAIFAIGAGRQTNEEQVRAVTDYYDAHPDYLKAIPDYVRHQMAHFLKGNGYARIPMNPPHPPRWPDEKAKAKEMAADPDYQAFLSALPADRDKSNDASFYDIPAADALWKWWNLQEALSHSIGVTHSPYPLNSWDRGELSRRAVQPWFDRHPGV